MIRRAAVLGLCAAAAWAQDAAAFCGCFMRPPTQTTAQVDAKLYNTASQVVLARSGNRTVVTMMNDYEGELKDFAMLIPVPAVLKRGQIHAGDPKLVEKLDAATGPQLMEITDLDPCSVMPGAMARGDFGAAAESLQGKASGGSAGRELGVKIEAQYTVGEYDIVILSAKESAGLETWLRESGYKLPAGAHAALEPYIRQNQKFFVAKVNLKEHAAGGRSYLRPLQFAFESEKFMLPVRLGMLNAKGPQELVVYALTSGGRVEATNYRTVRMPQGGVVPGYVKDRFNEFYKAVFDGAVVRENWRVLFTESAFPMVQPWNPMGAAAEAPSSRDLLSLGAFWLKERPGQDPVVFLTRLRLRYTPETFPQDLFFQETQDRSWFRPAYSVRKEWRGAADACPAARAYRDGLPARRDQEAQLLARLTGWDINEIRDRIARELGGAPAPPPENPPGEKAWWESVWE